MTLPSESDTPERPAAESPRAGWITPLLIVVAIGLLIPLGLFLRTPRLPELSDGIPIPAKSSMVSWGKITIQPVVQVAVDKLPVASIVSGLSSRTYQRDVRISNVQIVDLDGDGKPEVLACDAAANQVVVYRNQGKNQWRPEVIGRNLRAPAHATVVDIDQDGDLDVVVAVLGDLLPSDNMIGSVVLLEAQDGKYHPHRLLDDVRRVADVQPGDFDKDGDIRPGRGCVWLRSWGSVAVGEPGTVPVPRSHVTGSPRGGSRSGGGL